MISAFYPFQNTCNSNYTPRILQPYSNLAPYFVPSTEGSMRFVPLPALCRSSVAKDADPLAGPRFLAINIPEARYLLPAPNKNAAFQGGISVFIQCLSLAYCFMIFIL